MMAMILVISFSVLQIVSYTSAQDMNVAVNQFATQINTLSFNGFDWTADKVVDNCTLQDDPNNQQCCSASLAQTKDFRLSIVTGSGAQTEIYDNACCEYGDGIFTIPANDTTVISIIATRPAEGILTLCEIQAFETIPVTMTTTASTAAQTTGTASDQGQNATSTQDQTTNTGQGQSTIPNQEQSTTSDPNSVPGTFHCKEVIVLLILNVLQVWKYT